MGLVSRVLSFSRRVRQNIRHNDVKVDMGGGELVQAEHFAPSGDDSPPLPSDYAYTAPSSRSGSMAALGYSDTRTVKTSQPGEVRRYARDSSGVVVSNFRMLGDGSFEFSNSNATLAIASDGATSLTVGGGSFEMAASGDVTINGVTITTGGEITAASITAPVVTGGGVTLNTHTHDGGTVGPPDGG